MFSTRICGFASKVIGVQAWRHQKRCLPMIVNSLANARTHWSSSFDSRSNHHSSRSVSLTLAAICGTACVFGTVLFYKSRSYLAAAAEGEPEPGSFRPDLPTFSGNDVARHNTKDSRIWVTYKNGVYDITDYIPEHPGGSRILDAAGGPLDTFFTKFKVHKSPWVLSIVEEYRIGNITNFERKRLGRHCECWEDTQGIKPWGRAACQQPPKPIEKVPKEETSPPKETTPPPDEVTEPPDEVVEEPDPECQTPQRPNDFKDCAPWDDVQGVVCFGCPPKPCKDSRPSKHHISH